MALNDRTFTVELHTGDVVRANGMEVILVQHGDAPALLAASDNPEWVEHKRAQGLDVCDEGAIVTFRTDLDARCW